MICPNCAGETETISGINQHKEPFNLERCSHCSGIWLDKGELEKIPPEKIEEIDTPSEEGETVDAFGLSCPKCYVALEQFSHPRLGENAFLRCPDCHGIWLKHGQLFKYMHLKEPVAHHQPDAFGTMTKRDRVLVGFTGFALMLMLTSVIIASQTGHLQLAADILRRQAGVFPVVPILILLAILMIFGLGLMLALFRSHRYIRFLGWGLVVFSLVFLFYLAQV